MIGWLQGNEMDIIKKYFPIIFFIILGIFIGITSFTFIYAKGYSYLLDDPEACVNCHVMRENYNSWIMGSHRNVKCNNCHTPDTFLNKYFVKAENGFSHSLAFTLGAPDVIRIKSRSANVVEENCIRCHTQTLSMVLVQTHTNRMKCFDCHNGVGHNY